jgi:hypothetical protein
MRRREFISLLGGAAVAWPLAARAQEPGRVYRLGGLFESSKNSATHVAFFEGMRRYGFIGGQNLLDDPNSYELRTEQFADHALEIVKQGVDLIGALAMPLSAPPSRRRKLLRSSGALMTSSDRDSCIYGQARRHYNRPQHHVI